MSKNSGFTLIELMVAMVVSLLAVSSIYSLGAAMSKQFYEEQRVATSQGTSRVAIMELRRDISRAGLFGSPNGTLEPTCDATPPSLPRLTGGNGPLGAFQYYPDQDLTTLRQTPQRPPTTQTGTSGIGGVVPFRGSELKQRCCRRRRCGPLR